MLRGGRGGKLIELRASHACKCARELQYDPARTRKRMLIWDICCGTKSVSNVWREAGHQTLTLDIDPKCSPDICTDIMSWEYTDFSLEPPDFIWCSPPCTHYSIARTRGGPRDLEGSDAIVQRCLDIIAYWRPRWFIIENPQTGLLKTRAVVQGLDFKDVDYCMYQDPPLYRKRTRLWTNLTWTPRALCTHKIFTQ